MEQWSLWDISRWLFVIPGDVHDLDIGAHLYRPTRHFPAIDTGHTDIGYDQRQLWSMLDLAHCLAAIFGTDDSVAAFPKKLFDQGTHTLVIVYEKNHAAGSIATARAALFNLRVKALSWRILPSLASAGSEVSRLAQTSLAPKKLRSIRIPRRFAN
jgi:hypothetical protein